nr:immunoglobulin heavy chain junction region [Macaca mulatta]MOX16437.1 immunoglobulin heavy chain junction region [Macaca mulatta]
CARTWGMWGYFNYW